MGLNENERKGLEKDFFELSLKIVEEEAKFKLYDMEYLPSQKLLKVFIHRQEKIVASLEDCVKVDSLFTPHLETLDFVPATLRLEVSSPGIFRQLKTSEHFRSAIDEMIKIKISGMIFEKQVNNENKEFSFKGTLRGFLKQVFDEKVEIKEEGKERILVVPFSSIKKGHVDPNWEDLISSSEVNV